ncbi:MAG: nitrate reductase molybdenum cofactor assembly chaperone [Desulfotignum sp.]|nr:nitrate reductase molybdenum cofactor assembly chaperone [Desulfotignum sp.]
MMATIQNKARVSLSGTTWRILSVLLDYPDKRLLDDLDQITAAARQIPEPEFRRVVSDFLAYLARHDLLDLQENYTAAFDLRPTTTLNLTYHAFGDNEKRAAALSTLQHLYNQAGWERTNTELPDYLPLMLEFLSIHPRLEPDAALNIWQCLGATRTLMKDLEKTAPAYALLLTPLARLAAATTGPDQQITRMTTPSCTQGGPS